MSEILIAGYPDDEDPKLDVEKFLDEAETSLDNGELSREQMQTLAQLAGIPDAPRIVGQNGNHEEGDEL